MESTYAVLPLGALRPGQKGTIVSLQGGRTFRMRCLALGCAPGTEVTMEHNTGRGPVIIVVRGVRLALGRFESMRLSVRAQEPAS